MSGNNSQAYPVVSKIRTNRIGVLCPDMPTRAPRAGLRAILNRAPDFRVRNQQPDPIGSVRVFALCRLCEIDHRNSIRPFTDFQMEASFLEDDLLIAPVVSGSSLSSLFLAKVPTEWRSSWHIAAMILVVCWPRRTHSVTCEVAMKWAGRRSDAWDRGDGKDIRWRNTSRPM